MDSLREELLQTYAVGERNFSMMDLHDIVLTNAKLSGINLSGANLTGADLTGADLSGANFTNADLSGALLARANLSGANLSWAKLQEADLVGANLTNAIARATNCSDTLLIRANMANIDALGAVFNKANLMVANLENAILECASLSEANFTNANLTAATLSWANLSGARMNWAILTWAAMDACNLEKANLTGACLRAANLSFANLEDTAFMGADLFFANLSGAVLTADPRTSGFSRLASTRISRQTYDRSSWTQETLRSWQDAGATILGLSDFPLSVQNFIRSNRCNLRIYFSMNVNLEIQIAYEYLLSAFLGEQNTIRILSTSNEKNVGQLSFLASNEAQLQPFVDAIKLHPWKDNPTAYFAIHKDSFAKNHLSGDIIASILTKTSEAVLRIEFLLTSKEEETLTLHAQMHDNASVTKDSKENHNVTWSYVNLPRINFRPN